MIITESNAFRKGYPANLVSPFRDSATLSTLPQKLYTRRVVAFRSGPLMKREKRKTPPGKFSDQLALNFEI
jgi:hypothetical protein